MERETRIETVGVDHLLIELYDEDGALESMATIREMRESNADSAETMQALDRLAAGSREERVGGGASPLVVLRVTREEVAS